MYPIPGRLQSTYQKQLPTHTTAISSVSTVSGHLRAGCFTPEPIGNARVRSPERRTSIGPKPDATMPFVPLTCTELLTDSGPIAAQLRPVLGTYESRPEQVAMAEAVAAAMESRGRLLVEAGTGVGKSFAYLVPAILRCLLKGEKVVVATATISLQEQLIQKDIPMLREVMEKAVGAGGEVAKWRSGKVQEERGETGARETPSGSSTRPPGHLTTQPLPALRPVLAKGRGNYLSLRRLQTASQRQDALFYEEDAKLSLHQIEDWAYKTSDGSLSTLPTLSRPDVWDHVRSDVDNCMGRKCPTYKKCFYQAARRELEQANLIICNHALFFSDLALRVRAGLTPGGTVKAILPNYDHVIFDEAHGIEDTACDHFGIEISQPKVARLLRTLFNPRRRKGYLLERSLAIADAESVDRAMTIVHQAEQAAAEFFGDLLDLHTRNRRLSGRIRTQNVIENSLTPAMRELATRLRLIREQVQGEGLAAENERFELQAFARRASELADCADALVGQTLDGYVYWVDVEQGADGGSGGGGGGGGGRRYNGPRTPRVTLACAPVEIGPILRRHLFSPEVELKPAIVDEGGEEGLDDLDAQPGDDADMAESDAPSPSAQAVTPSVRPKRIGIVLTSATLATRTVKADAPVEHAETAFAHAMTNLGITDARTLQLGSPFDYRKQARIIIDMSVPNPKSDGGTKPRSHEGDAFESGNSYNSVLSDRILHHIRSTDGGAFVLFTSFATLNAVADAIGPKLMFRGMPMFVHGRDGPRPLLLKSFMEHSDAVLLGAASFWQGVDVRGERLRNVIITRLPFEPPDRPLTQARMERIELCGGNPFMQDSLPRAIIRFKQGFGRLIRSKTDTGQVVVLDPRIATARYGRMFLEALPRGVPVERIEADQSSDPDIF